MRIGFDSSIFLKQKDGGISGYFINISNELIKQRLSHFFFIIFNKNKKISKLANNFTLFRISRSYYLQIILEKINFYFERLFFLFYKPTVIHQTYYTYTKKQKIPLITTIHDMIPEIFDKKYYFEKDLIKKKKKSIYNSDHIICVSNNTKKDLINVYNDLDASKISVIYPGRGNFEKYQFFKIPQEINFINNTKYILFVGKRGSYKNFNFFLESISNSKKILKDYKIICFGSEKFSSWELNIHKKFGFSKDSVIHVNANDYTLGCLYKNAHLLINPSLYEGFGMPPVEAMSLNCPVVSSYTGASNEVLKNSALFFNPESSSEIMLKCENILYNENLRKEYIEKGNKHSLNYSWEKCTTEIINLYKLLS
jgi:glycosyltransferase involved in cell wall biosynthesis